MESHKFWQPTQSWKGTSRRVLCTLEYCSKQLNLKLKAYLNEEFPCEKNIICETFVHARYLWKTGVAYKFAKSNEHEVPNIFFNGLEWMNSIHRANYLGEWMPQLYSSF